MQTLHLSVAAKVVREGGELLFTVKEGTSDYQALQTLHASGRRFLFLHNGAMIRATVAECTVDGHLVCYRAVE